MIPIERITVLNPRERNKRVFGDIVTNIAHLGLKRPITVTRRDKGEGSEHYDLVCGQGRLEAYRALGQTEIPAMVIDASEEDCLVMSLVENIARRQHRQIELVQEIGNLRRRGYSESEIARKTDLDAKYVRGLLRLLEHGEERLITAVEKGALPITVATEIAGSDDEAAQRALHEAYQSGQLRGDKLAAARRLIDQRNRMGRRYSYQPGRGGRLTADSLIRAFRQEADRQRLLVKKAELDPESPRLHRLCFADAAGGGALRHAAACRRPRQYAALPGRPGPSCRAACVMSGVAAAFEPRTKVVPIAAVLPVKRLTSGVKATRRYQMIADSIAEVGIIEPPVVFPDRKRLGTYLLLDGHLRVEILKDRGESEVFCLIATDDEAFTYNKRINRLAPIQEHFMIARAIERGVSERRIARALGVNVPRIRQKRALLHGICPLVVELLKDKHISSTAMAQLKKMRAARQTELEGMPSVSSIRRPERWP